jgi:DNA-binding response OmpR family regulator
VNSFPPFADGPVTGQKENRLHGEGNIPPRVQILLVEDDDRLRQLSRRFLECRGWSVLEAPDSATGLRILDEAERDPDVIITDVILPGGTGPQWIAEARTRHPEISVLFVSGYGPPDAEESEALLRHGSWLQKPYTFERLIREVETLLGRHQT